MEFSEPLKVSGSHVAFSPSGEFCCVAFVSRLEVRDAATLNVLLTIRCSYEIQYMEWSPDSTLILTANYKSSTVEVWSLENTEWRCKIDEGSISLIKVQWAPDSRHIFTTVEFNLRITIWSLISKTVSYIKYPKDCITGIQFSSDCDYLAVPERRECKDYVSIFETNNWQLLKNFEVGTRDLAGLAWPSDDSVLAIWDSLFEYKILIYTLTGQCLANYSAYEWALGIKCVTWSPSSQFLVVGSYDQKIKVLSHISWRVIREFSHAANITSENCLIFKEVEKQLTGYPATLASVQGLPLAVETKYEEEMSRPIILATIPNEPGKQSLSRSGVSLAIFSGDSRYLATMNDSMPTTVWIWNIMTMLLAVVLVHVNPVKDLKWSPTDNRLALCTGGSSVYFWTPFGCLSVAVPDSPLFQVTSLKWHPNGTSLILLGKNQFSICHFRSHFSEVRAGASEDSELDKES